MSYELQKNKKPTECRYYVKCKVVVKAVTYLDEQSTGTTQVTDTLVFLVPDESTQKAKFLMTWLPDTEDAPQELGCEIGRPIYTIFRAALWRRTQHVGQIHLMVMTKSAEELLKPFNGKMIDVEVLGEDEELSLDEQRDWTLPYKKQYKDAEEDEHSLG